MKTNFKKMTLIAIAAIAMISCSKDDTITKDSSSDATPISVSIALTEKNDNARSVAAPVSQVAVNFNSGYVIFTNSLGIVNKVTQIIPGSYPGSPSTDEEAAKAAGTKVWLEDMKVVTVGGEIKNVPAAATKVYIVGNLPFDVNAPAVSENISAIKDRVIRIASQTNGEGSVANVTLYGDGATLETRQTPVNSKYAKVEVNPIASRIEIGKISYSSITGFVTRFQIDGIFVNHYYPQMSLSGKTSVALVNNNMAADNTEANVIYQSGSYYNETALYDFDADGIGYDVNSSISWSAADPNVSGTKNVWAYNVLAPKSCDGIEVAALAAPHVVIRLSNFATTGDKDGVVYPGTQYLTIKKFLKAGTTEVIESFQPGWVYFITNLAFNESNLTDIPEQETVTAYVEAVLMSWTREEVDYEL